MMPVKIEANVTLYLLPTCENDIAEYQQKIATPMAPVE